MLQPAFWDTLWTLCVSGCVLGLGGLALAALPWTDAEINRVHEAAMTLLRPPVSASDTPTTAATPPLR